MRFNLKLGAMSERVSREVVLHEVDVMALQLLVDYSYTGGILITEDNVQVNYIFYMFISVFQGIHII